ACVSNPATENPAKRARAFARYAEHPDAYDALLGDLIPEELRHHVRQHMRQMAYDHGTNPAVEDDWAVYAERFEQRLLNPLQSLSTGLRGLDKALGGGLRGIAVLGGA